MVQFFCPGIPKPKGSTKGFVVRSKKTGKLVSAITNDNAGTSNWQDALGWAAKMSRVQLLDGPVAVGLVFYLPRPRSVKRELPEVKPDVDKLTRAALDALTGIAWIDDAQVVELQATKLYAHDAPGPGVAVRIWRPTKDGGTAHDVR